VRFPGGSAAKRLVLEIVGWTLVVGGLAAIVLPGPGLLMLFGGLAVLSQQYAWAERRVRPVEVRAKKAAAESVQTWPRIVMSAAVACFILLVGVLWMWQPEVPGWWPLDDQWWDWLVRGDVPDWWPLSDSWWFLGRWPTGLTLVASAVIAFVLLAYSFRTYRGKDPDQVARQGAGAE